MTGTIFNLNLERGYGFIHPKDGGRDSTAFFHMNDLAGGLEFDETLTERRVCYDVERTGKGLRARNVRPAND